jgi:PAS domain S-box-containing protein
MLGSRDSRDILVVDDSLTSRTWTRLWLEQAGFRVREAESGERALAEIAARPPDLVLLDVILPDLNGFDVTRCLRRDAVLSTIPIILVTSLDDVDSKVQGLEAGANDFLTKPPDEAELLARVRLHLRLRANQEELQAEKAKIELLYRVGREMSAELDLDTLLSRILGLTIESLGASGGSVVLLDRDGMPLRFISSRQGGHSRVPEAVWSKVLGDGLAGWVVRHRRGALLQDTREDPRWIVVEEAHAVARSVVVAPLVYGGRVSGVSTLTHEAPYRFEPAHLDLLASIAAQAGVVTENARLFTETERERGKLAAVLASTNDAVVVTDDAGRALLLNPAAERMLAVRASEVAGEVLADVVSNQNLSGLLRGAPGDVSRDATEVPVDGRTLYASVSPVTQVGQVVVFQDITPLKELERMRLESERTERERLRRVLECYVGPHLVDQVLVENGELLERRDRVEVVTLFADIRGFTSASARLAPEAAVEVLNDFFTAMTRVIYRSEGTVIDFIGDELMASFGAPLARPDSAVRAVEAAMGLQLEFTHLEAEWRTRWGIEVGLGVGIDRGLAVMGNVGTQQRVRFTLIGNVVNRAHRLVEQAGAGEILVSGEVLEAIPQERRPWVKLEEVPDIEGGPQRACCLRI